MINDTTNAHARIKKARTELESLKKKYNLKEPDRGMTMLDNGIKWRGSPPDYTIANLAYLKGKTMNHKSESLEELVENVVKLWEFEASHKVDLSQWTSIDKDQYKVSCNGMPFVEGETAKEMGNYGWLLQGCPAYNSKTMDFEASHKLFGNAFTKGFPFELIAVFSGPPAIVFSWRHWAQFTGEYICPVTGIKNKGKGQLVELFGLGRVTVNESIKICSIEIFYKPDEFLEVMKGLKKPSDLAKGMSLVGPGGKDSVIKRLNGANRWDQLSVAVPLVLGLFTIFAYRYVTRRREM